MLNEAKLDSYLKKCELQYRADHLAPDCSDTLGWLAPYCGSVSEIADQWVVTTSKIIVYAGTAGLFSKQVSTKRI